MAVSANYLSYVLDQLSGLGGLQSRRMFGGMGLYCGERFFALIDDDVLYFKVDDSNRADYTSRGCEAFQPFEGVVSMNYFRVPEEVLEDIDEAKRWARKAVAVATAAASAKRHKKTPKKKTTTRVSSSRRTSGSPRRRK
jgi:DNA transformation protein and related proteins